MIDFDDMRLDSELHDFHDDSELNNDFLLDDFPTDSHVSSSIGSGETDPLPRPSKSSTSFQLFHRKQGFRQDPFAIFDTLDLKDTPESSDDDMNSSSSPRKDRVFDLSYLHDKESFYQKLFLGIRNDEEKKQLIVFDTKMQASPFSVHTLNKVAKRIFGRDYLKGSGLSNPQIRDHMNFLEMKFYAIACRHLALRDKRNFSMEIYTFLDRFHPVFDSVFNLTSDHPCNYPQRSYHQLLMSDDSELELLFRFLAPGLLLADHGCDHTFFRRRSGLLLTLGEFMEFSGRQYTTGGGKTLATKLREACLDLITGNQRSTRKRKIKYQVSMPRGRLQRRRVRKMLEILDSESESNEQGSDDSDY